jgi:hypothetical protein
MPEFAEALSGLGAAERRSPSRLAEDKKSHSNGSQYVSTTKRLYLCICEIRV